jgi:eukaryotic-like serine/threonine-protein kinase
VIADPIQAKEIFLAALDRAAPADCDEFLRAACGGDAALREQVEVLLAAHASAGSFLEQGAVTPAAINYQPVGEIPGTRIGPYKLLQQIGEGGMGVVWMAEQTEPVQRKVALKVIRPGMDSRQVIARFEAERQALALMDHPNIARVLDGGEVGQAGGLPHSGWPYFVMELVHGVPITRYCDHNHLTLRQRLELFVPVCQAIQHAHQKGILHRDIKPSNILVALYDGVPVPKVIDFGVAKATGPKLTEKTMFTGFGQLIGTLEYMSPEQAQFNQLDIDTRSDIYSLGVLLYELLTGTTPIEQSRLRTVAFDETLRIIREEEPQKPSARLSTMRSAGKGPELKPSPHTALRIPHLQELDWIVMKALEKDRNRRYETASGLALDIQRYLHDEPVQACPPSALYRFRKFAGRNLRVLVTSAVVALALLLAVGSLGWMLRDQAARRVEADLRVQSVLDEATRLRDQKRWADARAAARRVELLLVPGEGPAHLRKQLRGILTDLEMVDRLEAVRLGQTEVKGGWWDLAGADPAYAAAFREYGIDAALLDAADAARRVRASAIREQLVAALDDWSFVIPSGDAVWRGRVRSIAALADPDDWRNRFRDEKSQRDRSALESLAARPEVADWPPSTVVLLGRSLQVAGAGGKSIEVLAAAQRRCPADFWLNIELSRMLRWHCTPPRYDEAAGYCRAALAIRPDSAGAWVGLGTDLRLPDHLDESMAAFRQAIALAPEYAEPHHHLGRALLMKEEWAEAANSFREAIRLKPEVAVVYHDLGRALRRTGDLPAAVEAFRKAVELRPGDVDRWGYLCAAYLTLGDRSAHRQTCNDMVSRFAQTKDPQVASSVVMSCVATADAIDDPQQLVRLGHLAATKENGPLVLGAALFRAGDYDAALVRLEEGNSPGTWNLLFRAMAHHHLGHNDQARDCLEQAQKQIKSTKTQWPLDLRTEQLRCEAEELIPEASGNRSTSQESTAPGAQTERSGQGTQRPGRSTLAG